MNTIDRFKKNDEISKEYIKLNEFNNLNNYNHEYYHLHDMELATYIHNNYEKLSDYEIYRLVPKCLSIMQAKSIVLGYELENYIESTKKPFMKLEKSVNIIEKILNRYQLKAGGFSFEDTEWIISRYGEEDIGKNEILLQNSVNFNKSCDTELIRFISKLEFRLNMIAENIKVDIRFKGEEKNKIEVIQIWVSDESYNDLTSCI